MQTPVISPDELLANGSVPWLLPSARAWNVKRCNLARGSTHVTMAYRLRVEVPSGDRSRGVDGTNGELVSVAEDIEAYDLAGGRAHEAIRD